MLARLYTVAVSTREYAKPADMTVIAYTRREAAQRAMSALVRVHDAMGLPVTPTSAKPDQGLPLAE